MSAFIVVWSIKVEFGWNFQDAGMTTPGILHTDWVSRERLYLRWRQHKKSSEGKACKYEERFGRFILYSLRVSRMQGDFI